MAMTLTRIDSQTLNGAEGINVVLERSTSSDSYSISSSKQARSQNTPRVNDRSFDQRRRILKFYYTEGAHGLDKDQMHTLLNEVFMPWLGERILYADDEAGNPYQARIEIKRFGHVDGPHQWEAEIFFLDGVWKAENLSGPVTTSPITITGNVFARPIITLTNGAVIARDRLTITDNTGHGVAGLLIRYTPGSSMSENNYVIYMNGIEIPFLKTGSELYFRITAPAPRGGLSRPTYVDVFYGASINNTTTAGQIDMAGVSTLTSTWDYTTDPTDPFSKPLPAGLAWHPGIVTRHPQSRPYTFGFDGTNVIRLIDRTATGTQYNLPDDADAYIITSPVEIESLTNLTFDVTPGYKEGTNPASGGLTPARSLRVTIATIDGKAQPDSGWRWSDVSGTTITGDNSSGVRTYEDSFPGTSKDQNHYTQWTFGENTFPKTVSWQTTDHHSYLIKISELQSKFVNPGSTGWSGTIAAPWDFPELAEQYIGCTVVNGEEGVYYLDFPEGAYRGSSLPDLTMNIQPLVTNLTYTHDDESINSLTIQGSTAWTESMVFEVVEVDPVTREPINQRTGVDDPTTDEPLVGVVNAAIVIRLRDSEDWVTVWEERVVGTADGGATTFSPDLTGLVSGAVQIAVVLRPGSSNPNTLDWGTLSITSNPVVKLQSSKAPTINASKGLSAQRLDGALTNTSTGEAIYFDEIVGADGGLIIDTENLRIEAGSGPFYGKIRNTGGVNMFNLQAFPSKVNNWTLSGDMSTAAASFEWYERRAD